MPLLAILSWPLIALFFFAQMSFARALVISTLVGYLFLPEKFEVDLPGLPPVDKTLILMAGMLLGTLFFRRKVQQSKEPKLRNQDRRVGQILNLAIIALLLAPAFTMLSNRTAVVVGPVVLPAIRPWDFLGMTVETLSFLIPFLLARRHLATVEQHRKVLVSLVLAGLLYSLLVVFEVRFSPQLHNWVYGYHQHSFLQHIRGDGYRPKVFLSHGLSVGFWLFTVTLAAFALLRSHPQHNRGLYFLSAVWLFGVLFISKNLAATVIALLLIIVIMAPRSWQLRFVWVIVIPFLLYPAIRQSGFAPTDQITQLTERISPERAQSFQFRLDNEDQLLARALEKPVFGWGTWGRSLIYNDRGERTSTSDGTWIIVLGESGWIGYLAFFTLLTVPLLALMRVRRRKDIPIATMALALIMTGNLIYLIPNSALSPIGWLMAGALAGFVQFDREADPEQSDVQEVKNKGPRQYTRFARPVVQDIDTGIPQTRSTSNPKRV
ncbi:O-antigen ligase family protein [Tateyamaria sp. ANG-S1]|uniref:O-antigen ligase family protein n=1 Tax=Tateyamaria sp. ANG-S1 TaxID=1577905 RepID=UPI00057E8ADB|nr:O-antigen ligase family protein [Tateyamaria sp. ANG-S1]